MSGPVLVGLGWKQDAHDPEDYLVDRMRTALPLAGLPRASHLHVRDGKYRQWNASSCVSFAKKRALDMAFRLQDSRAPVQVSARWDYWNARRQEWAFLPPERQPQGAPADAGSYPRLSMKATQAVGILAEELFPYDTSRINEVPDEALYREAFDLRGLSYYRIGGVGMGRVAAIADAMQKGFPVIFGLDVDRPYLNHRGSEAVQRIDSSSIVGGHMQTVLEVEADGTVRADNWWDPEWGFEDGQVRLSADLIGGPSVRDVYALRLPRPSGW